MRRAVGWPVAPPSATAVTAASTAAVARGIFTRTAWSCWPAQRWRSGRPGRWPLAAWQRAQAISSHDRMFAHRTANSRSLSRLVAGYSDGPRRPASAHVLLPPARLLVHHPAGRTPCVRSPRRHSQTFRRDGRPGGRCGFDRRDGRRPRGRTRNSMIAAGASPLPPPMERSSLTIDARLHWVRFRRATPVRQAIFHLGMVTVGRWCRTLIRKLLQRLLIARVGSHAPFGWCGGLSCSRPATAGARLADRGSDRVAGRPGAGAADRGLVAITRRRMWPPAGCCRISYLHPEQGWMSTSSSWTGERNIQTQREFI